MSEPAYGSPPSPDPEPSGSLMHEPPHPGYPAAPSHPTSQYPTSQYQAGYQAAGYAPPGAPTLTTFGSTTASERNWATAAHLSGFIAAFVALGFLGPLVVLLTGGSRSLFVRRHAVEALNFNLSVLLWLALAAVLLIVLVGLVMLPAIGILYLVSSILGAMAASRGDEFRYPLTIRFVH